ncbi:hypothetical protein DPEC_G00073940 [Dallia pectoralis]|uniref:Uncharacterized protein n=1 Tax=Dallia pectoralis TaxID=75939 RepID=A0ACC2H3Q7_DALPE|nr:hypothetical protein DPEC_G00073940 [Dallia pectoralis]
MNNAVHSSVRASSIVTADMPSHVLFRTLGSAASRASGIIFQSAGISALSGRPSLTSDLLSAIADGGRVAILERQILIAQRIRPIGRLPIASWRRADDFASHVSSPLKPGQRL